ncbi:uncharacterized protein N0V89_006263 [Didymosphaeria variabile]|uniref:DNA replication regulator Sld3 C-terminal domain-containing protein n=1 Tax=Didymosphaeria variabile TaxID=1932322 RepID=A0A9W8XMJ9_9PLEO|nr:uncharacterized protein N0V89_006263 [Didymosphaeria variabile]KAJ4354526.1 hypothetical protein N0V89_006263 [Didymosphaeria variabile]
MSLPPSKLPRLSSAQRAVDPKQRLPSKQKRDSICGLGTFTKPFTIRPCPESPYNQPHTFVPIRVIARSQLPLSLLDTTTDNSLASNQLFSASIDVLERFHREKSDESQSQTTQAPRVLIARHGTKKTLYAMERVQERVYSLCKLAIWLKEKDVTDLWDPENLHVYPTLPKVEPRGELTDVWWKHAVVDTPPAEKPAKRARLSMLRLKPSTEPIESHTLSVPSEAPAIEQTQNQAGPTELHTDAVETSALPTPQEQLHNFVDQYLDALYVSKTSLAYFAKGPIARIRNAFTSTEEGAPATHEMVTFMRSMLLSHKAEEKKYREKLSEVIKDFPPRSFSDDDLGDAPKKPKKSKKKVKPNRDGMYPQETEVVKKWWFGGISTAEMARDETVDQRIKRRLGDLRVREALLQMILILEITALESLAAYKAPMEGQDGPAEESQATSQAVGESQSKPKRKKKLDNVTLLLDLLLDKLCIWQSIEEEGVLDFDAKKQDEDINGSTGKDRLQSFCVEVIIPFYMNRLPDQARMVNKKLGGPAPLSPPKRKAMRPSNVSRKSGEPKESESKKPRRSLGRVATDTTGRIGSVRAPSLNRSVTDSTILNGIKREGSEVPLSAIPFQRSPSNAARQSASHLKLLKGREMDLKTTSKAAAARAMQRKRVEEDLRDAISTLKKPNRGLAAGSYADDIEKRGLGSLGSASSANRSRKPANPVRKIMKDVQVTATPNARRRMKDMLQQDPIHHDNPFVRPRPFDGYPSSDFCIPSSAARPPPSSVVPATVQRSATARKTVPQGVAETPSKPQGARKFSIPAPNGRKILTTPSKARTVHMAFDSPPQAVQATPTKATASSPLNDIKNYLAPTPRTLFATPLKKAAPAQIAESPLPALSHPAELPGNMNSDSAPTSRTLFATPMKNTTPAQVAESPFSALPHPPKAVEEPSIYDALGWNDDDDFM